jgi:hypothetical protein
MGKARVATKILKKVAKVAGNVTVGASCYLLISTLVVATLSPAPNYRNISVQTSNWQTVETLPSSFEMYQLGYVPEIAREAEADAQTAGVDSSAKVTKQDIDNLAEKALPYITHELKTERVNSPDIHLGKMPEGGGKYLVHSNKVVLSIDMTLGNAVSTIPHELTHAQFTALPFYKRAVYFSLNTRIPRMRSESNPMNETFANVLALEVLANQALDGDIQAKQVFFKNLDAWLTVRERKESGEKISGQDFQYYYRPAEAVVAALSGIKPKYSGIELDATVKLIRQETEKMMRSSENR